MTNHFKSSLAFFLLAGILFFSSCDDKDEGETLKISILKPYEGSVTKQLDSIAVQIEFSSSVIPRKLSLQLTNTNMTPVGPISEFDIDQGSNGLEVVFDAQVDSPVAAEYYLVAEAFCDDLSDKAFAKLKYNPDIKIDYLMFCAKREDDSLQMFLLDENGNSIFSKNLFWGDSIETKFNPQTKQLILAGQQTKNITSLQLPTFADVWTVNRPPFLPYRASNNSLAIYENQVFSAYDRDYIRSYDANGGIVFSIPLSSGEKSSCCAADLDYVLFGYSLISVAKQGIKAFYRETSSFMNEIEIQEPPFKIVFVNSDTAILFCHHDGGSSIYQYNIPENRLNGPLVTSDKPFIDACLISETEFAVLVDDAVLKFEYPRNFIYSMYEKGDLRYMAYDSIQSLIWVVSHSEVCLIDPVFWHETRTIELPFPPDCFELCTMKSN